LSESTPSLDRVAVCIAAFNEEKTIGQVVRGLRDVGCKSIIVADDGSSDNTSSIAKAEGAQVITLARNSGQWSALKTAFSQALKTKANVIVTFDADGQHQPVSIPDIVSPVLSGRADITVGSRYRKTWYQKDPHRRFGINVLNLVMWTMTGHKFTDCTSGLTAINANVVTRVLPKLVEPQFGRLEFWLVSSKLGANILEVPASMNPGLRSRKGQLRFAVNLLRTIARTTLSY
jgi:UDP-N-acetylglucosamine---dolichyl-phosphate N-acetylglucosaminyltransferase